VIDAPDPNYTQSMQHLMTAAQTLRQSIQELAQLPPGDRRDEAIRSAHQALFDAHQAMINLPPQYRSELGKKVAGASQAGASAQQQASASGQQGGITGQQMQQRAADTQQAQHASAGGHQMQPGSRQGGSMAQGTFDALDRNGDGYLSMMEVAADEDSKQIFKRLDQDGDYKLSRSEWGDDTAAVVVTTYSVTTPVAVTAAAGTEQQGQQAQFQQAQKGQGQQATQAGTDQAWEVSQLYRDSWSGREMIGTRVIGDNGSQIGEVRDIVVNENGQIGKVIVEVGGFLEIGDQHIGVPWEQVSIASGMRWIQVPLREVEDGTYSLFGRVPQGENVPIQPTSWRVNELIGDVVSLQDVGRNGLIMDVIFNGQGQALGVVVDRGVHQNVGGWYAYPYGGYYPGSYGYPLPFQGYENTAAGPFSYRELAQQSPYATDRNPLAERESWRDMRSAAAGGANTINFATLDRDGNGFLSAAEVEGIARFRESFDRFDLNNDNRLSRSEWQSSFDTTAALNR
jgi:sporulation protein YlmC with PRC-barrel domain